MAIVAGQQALAADVNTAIGARALISRGTYDGNNSANRAIPHGLGKTPKIVIITALAYYFHVTFYWNTIVYCNASVFGYRDVTVMNATNFFVGNAADYAQSANATGITYEWQAIS